MAEEFQCQCSFCGTRIEKSHTDPVFVVIPLRGCGDGASQTLSVHLACLRRVVHPSVPLDLLEPEDSE